MVANQNYMLKWAENIANKIQQVQNGNKTPEQALKEIYQYAQLEEQKIQRRWENAKKETRIQNS